MTTKLLDIIMDTFPKQLAFAFAYGSGVFPQSSQNPFQNKMIDLIFASDNSAEFHEQNLKLNFHHYSFVKWAGAEFIKGVQEDFGAKIYFNSLIRVENNLIKYGVISTKDLIDDLLDWQTLYVSGRLHKPVKILREPENIDLTRALVTNRQSAVHAALLCLPEVFSEDDLYLKIAQLSYNGDFRMYFGEDKYKVEKIVKNQREYFQKLYYEHLKTIPLLHWKQSQGLIEQDCSAETVLHHLNLLPKKVQHNIFVRKNKEGEYRDMEEVLQSLAHDPECNEVVDRAIREIVLWPSITQSVKGIITSGIIKSVKYSSSKLKKMIKSLY